MYTHAYIYVPSTGDWGGWDQPVTSRWELSNISVLRSSGNLLSHPSLSLRGGWVSLGDTEVGLGQCLRLWGQLGC